MFVSGCPTVLVPAKVVQALNLNFDDLNGHAQPRFLTGFASEHGNLISIQLFIVHGLNLTDL